VAEHALHEELTDTDKKYVSFSIGEEYFGIHIDEVKQIIRVPRITRVPKMPDFVLGICNLRGSVLPVIDLSLRLGLSEPCGDSEDARVIVVEKRGMLIGLVVEAVNEVKSTESGSYEEIPAMLSGGADQKFISGIFKMQLKSEIRLVQIVDTDELVNISELQKNSEEISSRGAVSLSREFDTESDLSDYERFISFDIHSHSYAIEIHKINEIIRIPEYVAVPGLDRYVKGIFSLREKVIPLVSLHSKFGKTETEYGEDARVVIIEIEETLVGFVAEKVNEVLSVPVSDIEEPPRVFSDRDSEVSSIIKADSGEKLIMILDTDNLLKSREVETLKKLAEQKTGEFDMEASDNSSIDERQIVTFTIEDEEYGIFIEKVQEINRYTNVTRVPKTPVFVEGIINLRGEVIPLIDLRKRFELEAKERDEFTRVILVNLGSVKVGFVVDFVDEVLRVNASDIDDVPPILSSTVDNQFLSGVVNVSDKQRMILLLNVDDLFSKAEKKKLEKIGS
jgi:purine-binding chemotaxis protein CheW